jgi:hypothetical protein
MADTIYYPPAQWYIKDDPLVYLAGSIKDNWQAKAIELLHAQIPALNIANPYTEGELDQWIRSGWEIGHIRIASAIGGIIFWLDENTTKKDMFECAEWIQNYKMRKLSTPEKPIKLVIGIADNFPEREYIIYRILTDCPEFIIATTLEETCQLLIDKLKMELS